MNITFPDIPPIDPMDGDYLTFEACTDGPPIKCIITFDALTPGDNDPEKVKSAFARSREQIHHTAQSMIDAGKIVNGEIIITRLESMPPRVDFPDVEPTVIFERDAVSFPAISDGEPVTCVVSFELLIGPGCNDADEAVKVFRTQKEHLHERARNLIQSGRVDPDRELLITTLA